MIDCDEALRNGTCCDFSSPASGGSLSASEAGQAMRRHLADLLDGLEAGTLPLRLPLTPERWMARGAGHFHLAAELFVQLAGWTQFEFPHTRLQLNAGEALLVPPRLLHLERVGAAESGEPFSNLVIYAEGGGLRCHLAGETEPGAPGIAHLESCRQPTTRHIHDWLIDAGRLGAADQPPGELRSPAGQLAARQARSLVCAATVGVLQALDERAANADDSTEPPLVCRVRVLVQNQLGDHCLSVQRLAEQLHCTPDYLSNVFSTVTGEHLTSFVNRQRITRATCLLRESALTSKEIAWACGYATQTYFIRTFRAHLGVTPKAWRGGNR